MKYVSIDIETTGVDYKKDQILSIGVVIEDTNNIVPIENLPSLHLVIIRDRLEGNVFALDMNKDIIELLKEYQVSSPEERERLEQTNAQYRFVEEHKVAEEIFDFLYVHGMVNEKYNFFNFNGHHKMKYNTSVPVWGYEVYQTTLTVAGKNFGTFDKLFLEKLPRFKEAFKIHQRILDPAILFIDWKEDTTLPNLNTCMQRAGVEGEVTHDAVADAKDVIKVLRTKYQIVQSETH